MYGEYTKRGVGCPWDVCDNPVKEKCCQYIIGYWSILKLVNNMNLTYCFFQQTPFKLHYCFSVINSLVNIPQLLEPISFYLFVSFLLFYHLQDIMFIKDCRQDISRSRIQKLLYKERMRHGIFFFLSLILDMLIKKEI